MWLLALAFLILPATSALAQVEAGAQPEGPPCPPNQDPATRLESCACSGHDAELLARVLGDRSLDEQTRRSAALGLGRIGGDRAVRYLEGALRDATPDTRSSIARALGHTRSRLAVPLLIGMFGNNDARDEVCDALVTLTHRTWCDGTGDDRSLQIAWRRWWSQMKSRVEIYGPESCLDVRVGLDASEAVAARIGIDGPARGNRVR